MMITVYVPIAYLEKIGKYTGNDLPRPSEFWLTKPDSWMAKDIGTVNVTPETWQSWNIKLTDSKFSSKQLLTD